MTDILHLEISGRQQGKTTRSFNKALEEHDKTGKPILLIIGNGRQDKRLYRDYAPAGIFDKIHTWNPKVKGQRPLGLQNPIVIIDGFDHIDNWGEVFRILVSFAPSFITANTTPSYLRSDKDVMRYRRSEEIDPILQLLDICLEENYTRLLWLKALTREWSGIEVNLLEAGLYYKSNIKAGAIKVNSGWEKGLARQ